MGQAGTGKTTWLINQLRAIGPQVLEGEFQRILGLTFMHGSRRRLDAAIRSACAGLRATVMTIDSFALLIVNRWRSTLDIRKVVVGCNDDVDFEERAYAVHAGFDRIVEAAVKILETATAAKLIGATYPLVAIDEFQDCHGCRLNLIGSLGRCTRLLVAADEFQLLDVSLQGCPAVDWARRLCADGNAEVTELQTLHRTSEPTILETARCLRSGCRVADAAVSVQCFNGHGEAGYRILETIYWKHPTGLPFGTRAVISPSRVQIVGDILTSLQQQCMKRNVKPLNWRFETNESDSVDDIIRRLVPGNDTLLEALPLTTLDCSDNALLEMARSRLVRFARLKGLIAIPYPIVCDVVERTVHEVRAFGPAAATCVVTTVHGAKNREFDDVFIVWPYSVAPGSELQRRLLYNAVTRAKRRCIILVQGGVARAQGDSVLQLLGQAAPIFAKKKSQGSTSRSSGKKSIC